MFQFSPEDAPQAVALAHLKAVLQENHHERNKKLKPLLKVQRKNDLHGLNCLRFFFRSFLLWVPHFSKLGCRETKSNDVISVRYNERSSVKKLLLCHCCFLQRLHCLGWTRHCIVWAIDCGSSRGKSSFTNLFCCTKDHIHHMAFVLLDRTIGGHLKFTAVITTKDKVSHTRDRIDNRQKTELTVQRRSLPNRARIVVFRPYVSGKEISLIFLT